MLLKSCTKYHVGSQKNRVQASWERNSIDIRYSVCSGQTIISSIISLGKVLNVKDVDSVMGANRMIVENVFSVKINLNLVVKVKRSSVVY